MSIELPDLRRRTAVVTGASRGIGREIALLLADCGADVVVAARSLEAGGQLEGSLSETVRSIRARGGRVTAVQADLSVPADRDRVVEAALSLSDHVDILVNNAAVTFYEPLVEFRRRRMELMLEVQIYAPLHLMQLTLPGMVARGEGWVVNISSVAARHPTMHRTSASGTPGKAIYGMCKAAIERMTTGAAIEHVDDGIAINSLAPSRIVPTPGTIFHGLTAEGNPDSESALNVAWAAMKLSHVAPSADGNVLSTDDVLDDEDRRAIHDYAAGLDAGAETDPE